MPGTIAVIAVQSAGSNRQNQTMTHEPAFDNSRTAGRFRRPASHRLRSTAQLQSCYGGVRAGDEHLLVFAARNSVGHHRTGFSVSKKHGNAVARNRKKRLLREATRLECHELPHLDFVLVPRQTATSTLSDYRRSLVRLARRLGRSLEQS